MCIDDFDLGQIDDYQEEREFYRDDDMAETLAQGITRTRHPISGAVRPLSKEDYADLFLENFN